MCGMTRLQDIEQAVQLGVDAIGLIFHPQSVRCVGLQQAITLTNNLPPFVDTIAVMVNPEEAFVRTLLNELPIQCLQFHGDESSDFCQQFDKPFIKTIHPTHAEQIENCILAFDQAQALLFDSAVGLQRGGTGLPINWQLIPKTPTKPFILAGGLTQFNVSEAIQVCNPYAVDVCSGIETTGGVKDHDKMEAFIKAVRRTNNESRTS